MQFVALAFTLRPCDETNRRLEMRRSPVWGGANCLM